MLYAGALISWALGLYVISRGGPARVPLLTFLATAALVVYLSGQGLAALAPAHALWLAWLHRSWWAAGIAPSLWLCLTLALFADEGPEETVRRLRPLLLTAAITFLAAGLALAVLGTTTDDVLDWSASSAAAGPLPEDAARMLGRDRWFIPPNALFTVFQVYFLLCCLGGAAALLALFRLNPPGTPLRGRFGALLVTAGLFLLFGLYFVLSANGLVRGGSLLGDLLVIAGIVIMAGNVARYGALLAGEVVLADALAFGVRMGAVVLLYALLLLLFAPHSFEWLDRALPLVLILMATHVLADRRSLLIDRLLYGGPVSALRNQLSALALRVVRQPDLLAALAEMRESVEALTRAQETQVTASGPSASRRSAASEGPPALPVPASTAAGATVPPDQAQPAPAPAPEQGAAEDDGSAGASMALRVLVEGALRHLNDVPALAQHPLLESLPSTANAAGTALERAALLRQGLSDAIDRLRPAGAARPTPGNSAGPGGWLHYLVLHEAYVEGRPNKQIMQRYHLSEGTFHRARRRAIDVLAMDLQQRDGVKGEK